MPRQLVVPGFENRSSVGLGDQWRPRKDPLEVCSPFFVFRTAFVFQIIAESLFVRRYHREGELEKAPGNHNR